MMNRRHAQYALAGILALLTFALYLPALWNDFVNWDDDLYVYNNQNIRSLGWPFLRWAFTSFHAANWHPLTWISHALDYAVWGLNPLGHHLTSVVLHALNAFLVVLLVKRLLEAWRGRSTTAGISPFLDERGVLIAAGTTGILFGLHPVHVESVAWVAERKDVLCGLFYLLSVLAYARSAGGSEEAGTGRGGWTARFLRKGYLSSLAFFALALMSKPMAVSLPLVLLLLDWFPFRRIRSWRTFRDACIEKLPFLLLSALSSALTMRAQYAAGAVAPFQEVPLAARLIVAAQAVMTYLWKMAAPLNLIPFYPYPENISFLSSAFISSLALICVVCAACLFYAKKQKFVSAAWLYYLITLAPVVGIVQVGEQSMADRYAYLPSLGPFLLIGCAAAGSWTNTETLIRPGRERTVKQAIVAAAFLLLVALFSGTLHQISLWKNSLTLWDHVIEKEPVRVPLAYHNRGQAYRQSGRFDQAIHDYTTAISLDPGFLEAYNSRGIALREAGRIELAIEDYTAAITLDPAYAPAYNNRGVAFMSIRRVEEAIRDFDRAISLDHPSSAFAYNNRGKAFEETGRRDRAIEDYTAALAADPFLIDAYMNRGAAFGQDGQFERAIGDFTAAIGLDPFSPGAHYNRGRANTAVNKIEHALSDYEQLLSLDPEHAAGHMARGELYLRTGRSDLARKDFQKVCSMGWRDGCNELRALKEEERP